MTETQAQQPEDKKRFYEEIPDYRTADQQGRVEMDAYIAPLVYDDMESVLSFGQEASTRVNEVSAQINQEVIANNTMVADLKKVGAQMAAFSLEDAAALGEAMVNKGYNYAKENKEEVAAAGIGGLIMGPVGMALGFLGVKGFKKGAEVVSTVKARISGNIDYEQQAQQLRQKLRHASGDVAAIKSALENAQREIPHAITKINQLGRAQVEAYSNLAVAIGAGQEVLRRYQEEKIPAAADEATRENLMTCFQMMEGQVEHMIAARAMRMRSIVTLEQTKRMYGGNILKIRHHLQNSTREWDSQIASGHLIADQYDVQEAVTAADKKSLELVRDQQKMHEALRIMHQKSQIQGTQDLRELVQITNGMIAQMQAEQGDVAKLRMQRETEQRKLIEATATLHGQFKQQAVERQQALLTQQGDQALPAPVSTEETFPAASATVVQPNGPSVNP